MDTLESLKTKIDRILEKQEQLLLEKEAMERKNSELQDEITALRSRLAKLTSENGQLQGELSERNQTALKRINRLVEKIDLLQGEMKFS
jgi:predicted nuclease with TOPRIM domain